jgi:hypothetical protein
LRGGRQRNLSLKSTHDLTRIKKQKNEAFKIQPKHFEKSSLSFSEKYLMILKKVPEDF